MNDTIGDAPREGARSIDHSVAIERAEAYAGQPRPLFTRLPIDYRVVPLPLRVVALRLLRAADRGATPQPAVRQVRDPAAIADAPTPLVITHDVDSGDELASIERIRAVERDAGVVSAWGFVPAVSWPTEGRARALADEGCEVYWHDIEHNGRLPYQSLDRIRRQFADVDARNPWAGDLMRTFRSGQMLMSPNLLQAVSERFDVDMSIPYREEGGPYGGTVGCGAVHPFPLRGLLELPLTLTQDVFLRGVRRMSPSQTIDHWARELEHVRMLGGVAVLNVHPVWLDADMLAAYRDFLASCSAMTFTTPRSLARTLA